MLISVGVIQDFHTGDPIDLLRSRRTKITEPYFASIPREERNQVKYLLTDMYNPYLIFVDKYFPNAVPVVDSFHVVQWIIHSIDMYVRQLEHGFRQRDREREAKLSAEQGRPVSLLYHADLYIFRHDATGYQHVAQIHTGFLYRRLQQSFGRISVRSLCH